MPLRQFLRLPLLAPRSNPLVLTLPHFLTSRIPQPPSFRRWDISGQMLKSTIYVKKRFDISKKTSLNVKGVRVRRRKISSRRRVCRGAASSRQRGSALLLRWRRVVWCASSPRPRARAWRRKVAVSWCRHDTLVPTAHQSLDLQSSPIPQELHLKARTDNLKARWLVGRRSPVSSPCLPTCRWVPATDSSVRSSPTGPADRQRRAVAHRAEPQAAQHHGHAGRARPPGAGRAEQDGLLRAHTPVYTSAFPGRRCSLNCARVRAPSAQPLMPPRAHHLCPIAGGAREPPHAQGGQQGVVVTSVRHLEHRWCCSGCSRSPGGRAACGGGAPDSQGRRAALGGGV